MQITPLAPFAGENINNMNLKIELPQGLTNVGLDDFDPASEKIVVADLIFLIIFIERYLTKRKTINKSISSYGLKHAIERIMYNEIHVSNGEVIAAMIICGYDIQPLRKSGLNCHFNLNTIDETKIKKSI